MFSEYSGKCFRNDPVFDPVVYFKGLFLPGLIVRERISLFYQSFDFSDQRIKSFTALTETGNQLRLSDQVICDQIDGLLFQHGYIAVVHDIA